jgi:biopolymer transport protein ExbD
MARTFKRNRQIHAISELNVTNMLDLAFVLLIIFMIATPLIHQEQKIEVNLPAESARPQNPPPEDTRFVAVTVMKDGTYRIDQDAGRVVSARDLPARLQALAVASAAGRSTVVSIRGDAGVDLQKVITLMDELKKVGLNQISFATQQQTVSGGRR